MAISFYFWGIWGWSGEQLSFVYPWSLEVLLRQVSAAPGCGTSESSCCSCPPGEFPAHQPILVRLCFHRHKTLRASTGLSEAQAQMTSLETPQLPPELCSSLLPHLPTKPFPSLPRPPVLCCLVSTSSSRALLCFGPSLLAVLLPNRCL